MEETSEERDRWRIRVKGARRPQTRALSLKESSQDKHGNDWWQVHGLIAVAERLSNTPFGLSCAELFPIYYTHHTLRYYS